MNVELQIQIIRKLLALLALLVSLLQNPMQSTQNPVRLGGLGVASDDQLIADEQARQNNNLQVFGQYRHVKETVLDANRTYHVDEMLYPDGTRGYQIVITKISQELGTTGTSTGQMIDVIMQRSMGYGKNATELTWEK